MEMVKFRKMRVAGLLVAVGLAIGLTAKADENRELPESGVIGVSMDDAVLVAEDSYPALKVSKMTSPYSCCW